MDGIPISGHNPGVTMNHFQESRVAITIFWHTSTKQIFFIIIFFVLVLLLVIFIFVFEKKQLITATKESLFSVIKGWDPGSAKQGAEAWSNNQWKRGEESSSNKSKTVFKRAWRSSERWRGGEGDGGGCLRKALSRRRRSRGGGWDSVANGSPKETQTNCLSHRCKHWALRQPKELQVQSPNKFLFQETMNVVNCGGWLKTLNYG